MLRSQASGLAWLLAPIDRAQFFSEYWERSPLVVQRASSDYYQNLLTLDDIDRALTTLNRRYPEVLLKNASRDLLAADYTIDGTALDLVKVFQLFNEGATLTLAFLDTVLPSLEALCREIELELSMPLQANVYLTPPNEQGATVHYDTHDVFVLQIAGSKHWTLYNVPVALPLSGQAFDADVHRPGPITREFELRAGEVTYIPRGFMHEARTTHATSLHITLGVLRYTWTDLLLELVSRVALKEPAFRRSLPVGFAQTHFDRDASREVLQQLLRTLASQADIDEVLDQFTERFMADCPPLIRGQMQQLSRLHELTPDTVLGARPGCVHRLRRDSGGVTIECHGRRITLPGHAADAAAYALNHARYTARELPGRLDEAGRLSLVRRLIREGLVWMLPAADSTR